MKKNSFSILGAGVAGLGAAKRLSEEKINFEMYEAKNIPGGVLSNFMINGFTFDQAVHLSFTDSKIVRKVFDKVDYNTHIPSPICFENGVTLKHPVQNHLYPLPVEEKIQIIKSFLEKNKSTLNPKINYQNWLRSQYGEVFSKRFPEKYTIKYWDTEAKQLGTNWIGPRMTSPKMEDILKGAMDDLPDNYYYAKEMRYPKEGGYFSFISSLAEEPKINYNHIVKEIDLKNKKVIFNEENYIEYDNIISSIPLPVIISLISDVPKKIKNLSKELIATSVDLISFGINKDIDIPLWAYIYDEDIFSARYHSPSKKSTLNCPDGCSSIQFEIYSRGTKSKYTKHELIENCIHALEKLNICTEKDLLFSDHRRIPYGNVIFEKGVEEKVKIIHDYLNINDIQSIGRYGKWDYFWSDQSFLSGYEIKVK